MQLLIKEEEYNDLQKELNLRSNEAIKMAHIPQADLYLQTYFINLSDKNIDALILLRRQTKTNSLLLMATIVRSNSFKQFTNYYK